MGLQVPNGMAEQLPMELEGSGGAFQGGSKGGNLWSMDSCGALKPLLAPIWAVGVGQDGGSPQQVLSTHEEHVPPTTHMVPDGEKSCEARGTSSGIICDGQGPRSTHEVIVPHGSCSIDQGKQVVVESDPLMVDSDDDVFETFPGDGGPPSVNPQASLNSIWMALGSVMGSSRVDHLSMVLPKQKYQGHGVPPCPRSTTPQPDSSHSTKAVTESYVVLPPAAASMYRNESPPEVGGAQEWVQGESPSSGLQVNDPRFHSSIILKRDDTTQETLPKNVKFELIDNQNWNRPFQSFIINDALPRLSDRSSMQLRGGAKLNLPVKILNRQSNPVIGQNAQIEEEERRLQAEIEEIERQCFEANAELNEIQMKCKEFEELEERIENDTVGNYTITRSFNKQEHWTKALKYTLCNLKWVQWWSVAKSRFQPLSAHADVPVMGSSRVKQSTDPRS
ncbi:beclin 1 [Musa troglodytarum]|uniref:Beclin 1 n=1 Tax=Musa troglodytarum TaxID=320322 RepID=A0A9E7KF06_9LILI|nr:beclin 1 [Musa troglodytarum]